MRTIARFLLSCLVLSGCLYCLTCSNPESLQTGWLRIILDWDPRPVFLNTSAPGVIDSVRISLQPGNKKFTFRPNDAGHNLALEMDYYDVHVEALADSEKVYYVADTSRIFVQENTTNQFYLVVWNVRLTQAPEFIGLLSPFSINSDTVTLQWTSTRFAETYVLERSGSPDFSQKEILYTGESTHFRVSGLVTAAHYFRVLARNDLGGSPYSQVAAIQVALAENLIIETLQLNDCVLSLPYSQAVQATGGIPPYVWTVQGTLPAGLGFSQAGVFGGTAAGGGLPETGLLLRVSDSGYPSRSAEKSFLLRFVDPLSAAGAAGQVTAYQDEPFETTIQATGGRLPYAWLITAGSMPRGLSFYAGDGASAGAAIRGTPLETGSFDLTFQVSDSTRPPQQSAVHMLISVVQRTGVLQIATLALPDGRVGQAYSADLSVDGGTPPYQWSDATPEGLPEGFALDPFSDSASRLTGMPSSSGDFAFTVEAIDNSSPSQKTSRAFVLHIEPALLTIETAILADGQEGIPYSETIQAQGGTAPFTWAIVQGVLPDSLILQPQSDRNAALTGIPVKQGIYTFTVQATDAASLPQTDEQNYTLVIHPPAAGELEIVTDSLPGAEIGIPYSVQLQAAGGQPPYAWQLDDIRNDNAWQHDLALRSDGLLHGTVTGANCELVLTVRVTDSGSPQSSVQKELNLRVGLNFELQAGNSLEGRMGVLFNATFDIRGGCGERNVEIVSGSLPPGVFLMGASFDFFDISGTPTQAGIYDFTIQVSDNGPPQQRKTRDLSMTIQPASLSVITDSLAPGQVGQAYSQNLQALGGSQPYTWSLASGGLPAGLSLDTSTGNISGTPSVAGTSNFIIQVADNGSPPQTATKNLSITINPAELSITTASLASGQVGQAYNRTVSAIGGTTPYTWSHASGGLPPGLSLNASTGAISGTPSAAGTSNFTIQAADNSSPQQIATKSLSITINPSILSITTSSLASGQVGQPYSRTVSAIGGTTPYTWSLASGGLPAGLSLSASTGAISGTPSSAGTSNFTIQAMDNSSPQQIATKSLSITIHPAGLVITTASLASGKINTGYGQTVSATGGTPPYSWSLAAGSLPPGVSLDAGTGAVSGTPTAAGIFDFTVQVEDNGSPQQADTQTLSIKINIRITTASPLASGIVGQMCNRLIQAEGYGTSGCSWTVVSGITPPGLTFGYLEYSGAYLNGTPTTAGIYDFTVEATDIDNTQLKDSKAFSVTINPALNITTSSLPSGKINLSYNQSLSAVNGTTPYTWSVSSGDLPTGLNLNTSTGAISGTPTATGVFDFTVQVQDDGSPQQTDTQALSIKINIRITTSSPLPNGQVGTAYMLNFSTEGGSTVFEAEMTNGSLPSGMTFAELSGGMIFGTPESGSEGIYTFTIRVWDTVNTGLEDTKTFSLTIE